MRTLRTMVVPSSKPSDIEPVKRLPRGRVPLLAAAATAGVMLAAPAAEAKPKTLDDAYLEVSKSAPTFAGAFYDDDGNLTLNVALPPKAIDARQQAVVLDAFVRVFGKEALQAKPSPLRPVRQSRVQFQSVRYPFASLWSWYNRSVRPLLRMDEVRFSDIDERNNQLVLGVFDKKAMAVVWDILVSEALPTDLVWFQDDGEPFYQYSGSIIGTEQRPAIGGIEIGTLDGRCTLGMNAEFPNWYYQSAGFITAGHCSGIPDWWDFFGAELTQPEDTDTFATEFFNPDFYPSQDCSFDACRYSDSLAALYNADVEYAEDPSIIRTRSPDGDVNVDDDNQTFSVGTATAWILPGDHVQKMGAARGWHEAAVQQTCVDFEEPGSEEGERGFLCQFTAASLTGDIVSCRGDSGAPVFFWEETFIPNAQLVGILWAGRNREAFTNCAEEFVFSPMSGIVADLGPMSIGGLPIDTWY